MTEAAIALPVLLLMLFGIAQYGMILMASLSLRNAAAFGGRMASVVYAKATGSESDRLAAALSAAFSAAQQGVAPPLEGAQTIVEPVAGTLNGERVFVVTLRYDYPLFASFLVPGSSGSLLRLQASTTVR